MMKHLEESKTKKVGSAAAVSGPPNLSQCQGSGCVEPNGALSGCFRVFWINPPYSKMNKLLILLMIVTLTSSRPQADTTVRRQSFGLENFLFQGYEEEAVRNIKPKRTRPIIRFPGERTQGFEFENIPYESNRLRSPTRTNAELPNQRQETVPESIRPRPFPKIVSDSQVPKRLPINFNSEIDDRKEEMPAEANRRRHTAMSNGIKLNPRQETSAEANRFKPQVKLHHPEIESNRLRPPVKFNPEFLDQRDRLPPETNQWRPSLKYDQEPQHPKQESISDVQRLRFPSKIKKEELPQEINRWEPKLKFNSEKSDQRKEEIGESSKRLPPGIRKPEIQDVRNKKVEPSRLTQKFNLQLTESLLKQKPELEKLEGTNTTNAVHPNLRKNLSAEVNQSRPAIKQNIEKPNQRQKENQKPTINPNLELHEEKEELILASNQLKSIEKLNSEHINDNSEPRPKIRQELNSTTKNETSSDRQEEIKELQKPFFLKTTENSTDRIRKRIMMRRRRKRPQSNVQDKSEAVHDTILSTVRIPVFPQTSKILTEKKPLEVQRTTEAEPIETVPTTSKEKMAKTESTTLQPSTINLKTFLKQQTETLSLSEILQTQNLSLADLLRGNKDPSAILKVKQAISSTTIPTVKEKPTTEIAVEEISKSSKTELTTARGNYNRFHPTIPRTTTETKRSEPKAEESEKPKQLLSNIDPKTRLNDLRAKLRGFQKKTTPPEATAPSERQATLEPTTEPAYKKNRIAFKSANNPELAVILPKTKSEHDSKLHRPLNWNNRLPPVKKSEEVSSATFKPLKVPFEEEKEEAKEPPGTTEAAKTADIKKIEAKDEIIELLKSGQNAGRLEKILSSRNMTIQELLDNREKPPQVDISELFTNSHRQESSTILPPFDSFPDFGGDLGQTEMTYDEPYAEESARVESVVEDIKFDVPIQQNSENTDLNLQLDTSALWKLSEKSIYYGSSYGYGSVETEKPKTETKLEGHRKEKKFKLDYSDIVTEGDPTEEEIEKSYIPPAVKSAIIASGVVMGIALFVFIAIFAACGWKQRQIRLKSSSSILSDSLTKTTEKTKRTNTLSPVSFKDTSSYKKTMDFDDDSSESETSNTSSLLWSTIKHTFTSRTNTLRSRLEKEEKLREDKTTLRRNESRRIQDREDRSTRKVDRDRAVINTSFNFKRSSSVNANHFNECFHGY